MLISQPFLFRFTFLYTILHHFPAKWGHQPENHQRIISAFFSSERFSDFVYSLKQLDEVYMEDTLVFNELELRYGKEALDEIRHLRDIKINDKRPRNIPQLTEHQIEVWNALENAENECYENSFKIKSARYELHEEFERFIDSLYPR